MWGPVKARASPTRSPDRPAQVGLSASLPRGVPPDVRIPDQQGFPRRPLCPGQEGEFDEGAGPEPADGLAQLDVLDALPPPHVLDVLDLHSRA